MKMRDLFTIREAADDAAIPGLKPRYSVLTLDDFKEAAGKYADAASFVDVYGGGVIDPTSPDAQEGLAQLAKLWANRTPEPPVEHRKTAISALEQFVAEQIGAHGWHGMAGRPLPWAHSSLMGGSGTLFFTPEGGLFLEAGVENGTIYLPQIAVERTGSGLGTKAMEAIHIYAVKHGLHVRVYKVTNHPFYRRFDWLKQKGDQDTYVSTF